MNAAEYRPDQVTFLVSTMHGKGLKNQDLLRREGVFFINQLGQMPEAKSSHVRVKNYDETGLSNSRNRAIYECLATDIGVFSDDDVTYVDNAEEIIAKAFSMRPQFDILVFKIETPEGTPFRGYRREEHTIDRLGAGKVCSIEIAFLLKSILDAGIRFDNRFGLGSRWPNGEEFIFLADCIEAGLKVGFVPEVIVRHPAESSGHRFSRELMLTKGAVFRRVFRRIWPFVAIAFFAKKALKQSELRRFSFLVALMRGGLAFGG